MTISDALVPLAVRAFLRPKGIHRIRATAQSNSLPRHPKNPFARRKRREIAAMDETAGAAKGFSVFGADWQPGGQSAPKTENPFAAPAVSSIAAISLRLRLAKGFFGWRGRLLLCAVARIL